MNEMQRRKAEEHEARKLLNIGKTKRLLEDGLGYTEIAAKLHIPESTVRSYANIIELVKANEAMMD